MKYGYARTSDDDQSSALQLAALKRARCSHIYEDKGSTGAHAGRPALSRFLLALRAGDTLIDVLPGACRVTESEPTLLSVVSIRWHG